MFNFFDILGLIGRSNCEFLDKGMLMMLICGNFPYCISCSFLYVTISYAIVFQSHCVTNCMLKATRHNNAGSIDSIPNQVQSAITHSMEDIENVSQSFTLSQQGEQDLKKTLTLAAGEYMASQTQAAVEEAVNEVLHKDDEEDDLSKKIIDIILKNRMSNVRVGK
ncbi:hypothetical protein M405DRAFT_847055 [Rhizopogon salebrosus TDB-379]|nr:hypothetical protein M405DRAFT_847055 [Rhizopogon salebrosus TDB-379]